jgi:choline monooxygenase
MTTDREGTTRVFFNVCPHRGARLVIEDQAKAAALTCPYHGWAFGLDGSLRGRPHYHGPRDHDREGSRKERDCLFEVRSAVWNDWVFVNIDGKAPSFEDYMASAFREYENWDFGAARLAHYQPFEFQANWKLVVENFCDNYHVFMVHPALHDAQDVYRRTGMRPGGVHMFNEFVIGAEGLGLTVDPDAPDMPEFPNLSAENRNVSPFCNLFPNVTLAIFPSYVNLFSYEPVGVDKTIMHVWFYFMGEAARDEDHRAGREAVIADWANLNAEDSGICRRLQEGRTCDAYDGGRFSPYWDAGTLHFHRQIADAVRGEGAFLR